MIKNSLDIIVFFCRGDKVALLLNPMGREEESTLLGAYKNKPNSFPGVFLLPLLYANRSMYHATLDLYQKARVGDSCTDTYEKENKIEACESYI